MQTSRKIQAYDYLRNSLLMGNYAPGTRISEVALSKELGFSTIPIREALTQLVSEGLLEKTPGVGSFVKTTTRDDLVELYELRELLESRGAARAAERIGSREIRHLEEFFEQMHAIAHQIRDRNPTRLEGELVERQVAADVAFHLTLLHAAESPRLLKIVSDFRILTRILGESRELPDVPLLTLMATNQLEHWRILQAVRRRDSEAAYQAMGRHLRRAKIFGLRRYDQRMREKTPGEAARPQSLRDWISEMEQHTRPNDMVLRNQPVRGRHRGARNHLR